MSERCACGQPLHYTDARSEKYMREQVAELGEYIKLTVGNRAWMVPRHYIALHGIKGSEAAELAQKFGWAEAAPDPIFGSAPWSDE